MSAGGGRHAGRSAVVATVLAALALALVAGGGTATGSTGSTARSEPAATPVTKLVVVVVENHSLEQMRTGMPWTFRQAQRFGYATDYHAARHPSLPNYLAIVGGSTFGVTDDHPPADHQISGESVFGQALAAGKSAKVYAEGMPGRCARADGGTSYAVRHNPWTYFADERDECRRLDRPLTALADDAAAGSLPEAGMVVPNTCHDAHNCGLAVADRWMRRTLGTLESGPDWASGRLAVVVTADEDDRHSGNRVLTVVLHPSLHGTVVDDRLTHFSLTRLYDEVLGVPALRGARRAASMADAFGLPVGG